MESRNQFNVGGNIFKDRSGEKNNHEPESGNEHEVEEPRSGPWANLKAAEDDSGQGINSGWIIFWIAAFVAAMTIPIGRTLGIIVGLIAGLYFGVNWLRKSIIRQEVRPFSRESGFYWLIISIGGAFVLFLINYLAGTYPLP